MGNIAICFRGRTGVDLPLDRMHRNLDISHRSSFEKNARTSNQIAMIVHCKSKSVHILHLFSKASANLGKGGG